MVRIHDELWKATSDEILHSGDNIIVIGRHGLVVQVRRDIPEKSNP
ncbi:NfeD family protein [Salinisphaera sp. RV14]